LASGVVSKQTEGLVKASLTITGQAAHPGILSMTRLAEYFIMVFSDEPQGLRMASLAETRQTESSVMVSVAITGQTIRSFKTSVVETGQAGNSGA